MLPPEDVILYILPCPEQILSDQVHPVPLEVKKTPLVSFTVKGILNCGGYSIFRSSLPLQKRLVALSSSLRARFMSPEGKSVYEAATADLCITIDREDVLCSAVRHLGPLVFLLYVDADNADMLGKLGNMVSHFRIFVLPSPFSAFQAESPLAIYCSVATA